MLGQDGARRQGQHTSSARQDGLSPKGARPPAAGGSRAAPRPPPSVAATGGEPSPLRAAGRRWPFCLLSRRGGGLYQECQGAALSEAIPCEPQTSKSPASLAPAPSSLAPAQRRRNRPASSVRPAQPPRTVIIERQGPPPAPAGASGQRAEDLPGHLAADAKPDAALADGATRRRLTASPEGRQPQRAKRVTCEWRAWRPPGPLP